MKTLLLMRHGQAQDASPERDPGRKLTKKGERDAAFLGEKIAAKFGLPDFVVASDAARARRTAVLAAAGYQAEIALASRIYDATVIDLLEVIHALPDDADTVLLVGHNPGLAMLGVELDREAAVPPSLPPAGLIALGLDVAHWADVGFPCGQRLALWIPEHH